MQYRNGQRVKITGGPYAGNQGTVDHMRPTVGGVLTVRLSPYLTANIRHEHLQLIHPTPRFVEVELNPPHKTLADVEDGPEVYRAAPKNQSLANCVCKNNGQVRYVDINGHPVGAPSVLSPSDWLLPDRREPTYGDVPDRHFTLFNGEFIRRIGEKWRSEETYVLFTLDNDEPLQYPVWQLEVGDE